MRGRWRRWLGVGAAIVALLVVSSPAWFGLSTYEPLAQIVALRGWIAFGALAIAAVTAVCALLVRQRGVDRPARLCALATVLLLTAAGNLGVLLARGTTNADALPAGKQSGAIDVLALNTWDGAASDDDVAALLDQVSPDVVVLPETTEAAAHRIASRTEAGFTVFMGHGDPGGSEPTALLIAPGLGAYETIPGPDLEYGMVGARPVSGNGPVLYAVHVVSPVGDQLPAWREELNLVTRICDRTDGAIMAGDFNATVDHAPLQNTACLDGSTETGGLGTWPSGLAALLGAPIDHVLADGSRWRPVASAVRKVGGSDHRALMVRLASVRS